jgi:hypothetical protein
MTTLESRYAQRLRELGDEDERVEYMLDAVPFIREYFTTTAVSQPRAPKRAGGIDSFAVVKSTTNRSNVFQRYLATVEKDVGAAHALFLDECDEAWVCARCDQAYVLNSREAELVCRGCGSTRPFVSTNITYDQETQQYSTVTSFAYKRLNHFKEWLNSVQGKENTDIPEEVLQAVRAEFRKEGACKRGDVKASKVLGFLKKLKLNKYYEHKHAICNAISGVPAPKLAPELEEKLCTMFGKIQEPYKNHRPTNRKNFLSYSYVLYQFCELLGLDDYKQYFPLLKSGDKLYTHDNTWKLICAELGWEFIRTV